MSILNKVKTKHLIFINVVLFIIVIMIFNWIFSLPVAYFAPGSNVVDGNGYPADYGAPDGTYLQGDWGFVDSISYPPSLCGWVTNATSWSFAMCVHEGLGPLHGTWSVAKGTAIPIHYEGVFPIDARLYVTIKGNTVVRAEVRSQLEYGN